MYYVFYKTTFLKDGHYYYGVHKTNNLKDGYLGSGKILNNVIDKHGRKFFVRQDLVFLNSDKEMYDFEKEFVTEEIVNDPDCYNIALGGLGGNMMAGSTEEELENKRKRIKERFTTEVLSRRGKKIHEQYIQLSQEEKQKRSKAISLSLKEAYKNPELRKKMSYSVKEAMKKLDIKKMRNDPKLKEKMKLIQTSEEYRKKMSMSLIGRKRSLETRQRMKLAQNRPEVKEKIRQLLMVKSRQRVLHVSIDGRIFECRKDAMKELGINRYFLEQRLDSKDEKWKNWFYLDNQEKTNAKQE